MQLFYAILKKVADATIFFCKNLIIIVDSRGKRRIFLGVLSYQAIGRYASMVGRCGQIYFDRRFKNYDIGCGQQFFLAVIEEKPGISQFELCKVTGFDKGTTAKAVKKLEELNYLIRKVDESDKRVYHLFVTEKALPIVKLVYQVQRDWEDILTGGFTQEQREDFKKSIQLVAKNAAAYVKQMTYEDKENE